MISVTVHVKRRYQMAAAGWIRLMSVLAYPVGGERAGRWAYWGASRLFARGLEVKT